MDFSRAWTTLVDMVNGLIAALPDLLLAVLIFLCFYYFARRMQFFVIHLTEKRQKARNLGFPGPLNKHARLKKVHMPIAPEANLVERNGRVMTLVTFGE